MNLADVNWLAVLVAAIIQMLLGALWYSPLLFGNVWLRLIGKRQDELEAKPTDYAATMAASLVGAGVLALVIQATNAQTVVNGALTGGLVWLGFVATTTLTYSLFEGPPLRVWLLFVAYELVTFLIIGALLGAWN